MNILDFVNTDTMCKTRLIDRIVMMSYKNAHHIDYGNELRYGPLPHNHPVKVTLSGFEGSPCMYGFVRFGEKRIPENEYSVDPEDWSYTIITPSNMYYSVICSDMTYILDNDDITYIDTAIDLDKILYTERAFYNNSPIGRIASLRHHMYFDNSQSIPISKFPCPDVKSLYTDLLYSGV